MVKKNWDVLPIAIADTSMTPNSYDYYINEQAPYDITISKIRVVFTATGSDNSRFAIYRGSNTTAVLVAQTAILPAASISASFNTLDFITEVGQSNFFSKDENKAQQMARKIESGMVFINSSTMSDSRLPYGGVKNSGYGRTSADNALYEFTNNKVISLRKK